jgi:hypothetical protein
MENTSIVGSGDIAATEPIDRGRVWVPIMGKSSVPNTRESKDSSEHVPAGTRPASTIDSTQDRTAAGTTYTLRIKPDRRRKQQPIPPGTDRRGG